MINSKCYEDISYGSERVLNTRPIIRVSESLDY